MMGVKGYEPGGCQARTETAQSRRYRRSVVTAENHDQISAGCRPSNQRRCGQLTLGGIRIERIAEIAILKCRALRK
jgi:hypothetical protein